jgi:hypothetical protein
MPEQHGEDTQQSLKAQSETKRQEMSQQARRQGVFSQIEDTTYAILRKHEKQTA